MSRLVARILLCLLMFPLAVVCYCFIAITLDRNIYGNYRGYEFIDSGLVSWFFIAVYWIALWRKSVTWTISRRLIPTIAALLGMAIGLFARFALFPSNDREANEILLSILIPSLWLISTVFAWRETPAERAARLHGSSRSSISCPVCGYNLTGLAESRCPECGSKFTLDELLAAQPSQTAGEVE